MTRTRTAIGLICLVAAWSIAPPVESHEKAANATVEKNSAITNSIGMKLVRISPGKFRMGSPRTEPEREANEVLHDVAITKPFYLGAYEVTQAEFAKVMGEEIKAVFHNNNRGGPDFPMENVQWVDAEQFCQRLSARPEEVAARRKYRLPTEAEWEYTCRAGTKSAFSYGDSLSSNQAVANFEIPYAGAAKGSFLRRTAKVGSFPPNAFGLYDMHGNVAEWCADWFDPEYYNNSPEEDPLGPPAGATSDDYGNFYVVVRGGSWLDDARACRSAYRQQAMHKNKYWWIGFRVVAESDE
jgi:formylglycine-generating enzyme required for sulfatase activity